MNISNRRTTAPATEVATVAEMDTYLRGDNVLESVDGELLTTLIQAAREYVEEFTRLAFIAQTWTLYMDDWPRANNPLEWWDGVREGSQVGSYTGELVLPRGPLLGVTSLSVFDYDNTETVFSASNYFINTNSNPGSLILNSGQQWPIFYRQKQGIKVVYTCGYGDNPTDVPAPLRTAIRMLAAHWYENREFTKTQSDMNQAVAPVHLQSILNRYKVAKL